MTEKKGDGLSFLSLTHLHVKGLQSLHVNTTENSPVFISFDSE